MIDGVDEARICRYIDRRDEPSVPQVLGRFRLSPAAAGAVRELLGDDPNNRARDRQTAPEAAGGSKASSGRSEGVEEENRTTEAGLPGLPGLPGENGTPSPEIGGRGGVLPRVGCKQTDDAADRAGSR